MPNHWARTSRQLALLMMLAAGCASRQPSEDRLSAAAAELFKVILLGGTQDDERVVNFAAVEGIRTAQRWGMLRHPVVLRVHPDHNALERASRQANVPWMRGWARFDDVELEAPSNWGGDKSPENVVE